MDFQPIQSDDQWGFSHDGQGSKGDFNVFLNETSKEEIRSLLVGRRVMRVVQPGSAPDWGGSRWSEAGHLLLDDGTVLKLLGHEGGCSCGAGDYELTHLQGVDNVITGVEFEDDPSGDEYGNGTGAYRIFVFADNQRVNLATFEGTDGNGYYGTGYSILVRSPGAVGGEQS